MLYNLLQKLQLWYQNIENVINKKKFKEISSAWRKMMQKLIKNALVPSLNYTSRPVYKTCIICQICLTSSFVKNHSNLKKKSNFEKYIDYAQYDHNMIVIWSQI